MGTKGNPGEFDCYALALPDEPIFVLRASNEEAASLVEQWAERYDARKRKEGTFDRRAARKVKEALQIAEEMRTYRSLRDTVVPPPLPGSPPSEPKPGEVTVYDPKTRQESRVDLTEVLT